MRRGTIDAAQAMLERDCYLLGTGNSVPEYMQHDNYMALVRAAWYD